MQVSTFQGKGDMANAGLYLPRKGRHGECRVVVSREREAWFMEGNNFRGEGGIVNAG